MYIYSTVEPLGTPTRPGDDIRVGVNPYYFSHTDLFSEGKCSNCAACPKYWSLTLPFIPTGGGEDWSGTYILHRNPYIYQGVFSQDRFQNCAWETRFPDTLKGINPNLNKARSGWLLMFEVRGPTGVNWHLYSPQLAGAGTTQQSIYRFEGDPRAWKCMGPNQMRYYRPLPELAEPFPNSPTYITLTPCHA